MKTTIKLLIIVMSVLTISCQKTETEDLSYQIKSTSVRCVTNADTVARLHLVVMKHDPKPDTIFHIDRLLQNGKHDTTFFVTEDVSVIHTVSPVLFTPAVTTITLQAYVDDYFVEETNVNRPVTLIYQIKAQ